MSDNPNDNEGDQNKGESVDDLDLPLLDFSIIAVATDNFSSENKIGEGGFGPVYRVINSPSLMYKHLTYSHSKKYPIYLHMMKCREN